MLIVTQGVVNGVRKGGELSGLSLEQEERLIAEGVCERPGDDGGRERPGRAKPRPIEGLKARCRELGLPAGGKKAELEARIAEAEAALDDADDADDDADDEEPPALNAEVPR